MGSQALFPIDSVTDPVVAFGDTAESNTSNQQAPEGSTSPLNPETPHADSSPPVSLQDECLLPVQYDAILREPRPEGGERRLLLAVLKDAIRSYIKKMDGRSARARREFEETREWFFASNQDGIFAFEHLCDALGIQPGPLRRWLISLHDDDGSEVLRSTPIRHKISQNVKAAKNTEVAVQPESPSPETLVYLQP